MSNLIKAELFKLQRNKTFWVLLVTITGLSALLHYLVIIDWWQMYNTFFDDAGLSEMNAMSAFTSPLLFNLIVCTLAGFLISTEFSHSSGVIKNQVISGNKRSQIYIVKFFIYSLGAVVVSIVIPFLIGVIEVVIMGHGDILSSVIMLYLGRTLGLFLLQFLGYTSIIMLIAIVTEDSGKTIIISILFSLVMDMVRIFSGSSPFIAKFYENSIFYQFSEVFKFSMTNGEIIKSIIIAILTIMIVTGSGMLIFNRKEIK